MGVEFHASRLQADPLGQHMRLETGDLLRHGFQPYARGVKGKTRHVCLAARLIIVGKPLI